MQNPAFNFGWKATHFKRENVKTTHYGIQSVRYLGPKMWNMVPDNIKNCNSLNKFKNSIKLWKPNECPCRLCKNWITQVGFMWFTSPFCSISEERELESFAWFSSKGIFFKGGGSLGGGEGLDRLCRFFGWFFQGSVETVHFLGISSLGNWMKFLYFLQWLSLSFVFVNMFVICLFI